MATIMEPGRKLSKKLFMFGMYAVMTDKPAATRCVMLDVAAAYGLPYCAGS